MSSSHSIHTPPVHSNQGTNPFSTPLRLSRAPSTDERSTSGRPYSYFPTTTGTRPPSLRLHRSSNNNTSTSTAPEEIQKCASRRWRVSCAHRFGIIVLKLERYDEKPWATQKHPRLKWERSIFYGSIAIGIVVGAVICYKAYASVTNHAVILHSHFSYSS